MSKILNKKLSMFLRLSFFSKKNILFIGIALVLASCSGEKNDSGKVQMVLKKDDFSQQINILQGKMSKDGKIDSTLSNAAIKAYSDFVFNFPEDSLCAGYLFKAAEIATSIKNYQQSIIFHQTIRDKYPDFKYVIESLYLQAYIYDNFMNDDVKAKEFYGKLILQYPKHKLAQDSKFAIQNLGKSDEELIREFKKKNKINS